MNTNPIVTDSPGIIRGTEALANLLASARAEHEAGRKAERLSLEHYRRCGEALARAKVAAGHGKWAAALEKTGIPHQRASEYMRLAEGWSKLPPGGDFALKAALRLIADDEPAGEVLPAAEPRPSPGRRPTCRARKGSQNHGHHGSPLLSVCTSAIAKSSPCS